MAACAAGLLRGRGEPIDGSSAVCSRLKGQAVEGKWVCSLAFRSSRLLATMALQTPATTEKDQTMSRDRLWEEYFSDPSQWWDNRLNKKSPRSPDFRHRGTKEGLWIDSLSNPAWVKAELEGQVQCGEVRTLCVAGRFKEAVHVLNQQGSPADFETYVCLLQECINMKGLAEGKQVHAHIVQSGFNPNIFLLNALVNMYSKCGSVVDARRVFEDMPDRDIYTWNIMIAGYAKHGCGREALEIYEKMVQEGLKPDRITFLSIVKACATLAALEKGIEVHADIVNAGMVPDVILETAVVDMYAKCGSMEDARQVFSNMAQRNVVSWSVMIAGCAKHGYGREALEIYERLVWEGVTPDKVTFISVVNACANLAALDKGMEVHADIRKAEIVPDVILETALVDMYAKCGSIKVARQLFEEMDQRNVVSWNTMIAGYAQHGCGKEALNMYKQLQQEGLTANKVTFICVLNACASLRALDKGVEILADIRKAGLVPDVSLENALVNMYAKCRSIKDAYQMFDSMAERDAISWSTMIAAFDQNGCGREALEIYERMMQEGVMPDNVIFVCVLNTCANLGNLEKGIEVHADISKAGIAPCINLENTLLNMYAKCGSLKDACQVFDSMGKHDVVSWNTMIAGCVQHGFTRKAFHLYDQMLREGVTPDVVTFICVLHACAHLKALEKGMEVHADIIQAGVAPCTNLDNTLVSMYAKCGSVNKARKVFDNMAERDVVSWNGIIAGYAQDGCGREGLEMYEQMIREGVTPNKVTFVCVLNACASLATLEKGKEVHADIITAGVAPNIILETALVNMYAKCGSIKDARQLFDSMAERNVVTWNTMISRYGEHGFAREALELFDQMQQEGLKPDGITFVCLLFACSHMGLVDEGGHYFTSMSQEHGLTPTVEHFGCIVDLLSRAGKLDEAEDLINQMPVKPDVSVWSPLLGACRIHGDIERGERVAKCLL